MLMLCHWNSWSSSKNVPQIFLVKYKLFIKTNQYIFDMGIPMTWEFDMGISMSKIYSENCIYGSASLTINPLEKGYHYDNVHTDIYS